MGGADPAVPLCSRGRGQQRRQRFAGQCAPRAQIGGLGDPAGRLASGDAQPVGQRVGQPAPSSAGVACSAS